MDLQLAEQTLAAIAKLFRLSRLYPPTHPAVARAVEEVAAALPPLAVRGTAEWRLRAQGVFYRERQLLARNPALTELAQLLYSRGVRALLLPPGVTVEHLQVLMSVATGRAAVDDPALGPIELRRGRQAGGATRRGAALGTSRGGPPPARGARLRPSRRAVAEFRPHDLPVDVDARRWLEVFGREGEATAHVAALVRLEELADDVAALGDITLTAEMLSVLDGAAGSGNQTVPSGRVRALADRLVNDAMLARLVRRVGEPRVLPAERRSLVAAVAALTDRAVPVVVDVYRRAGAEARAAYLAVARAAGARMVPALLQRLEDPGRERAAAASDLLGATGSPDACGALAALTRHESALVRERALVALAEIGGAELGRTAAALLRDPAPAVRQTAARALAAAHETAGSALLLARLAEEGDQAVMMELLGALGRLGGPAVVDTLAEYAEPGVARASHPTPVRVAATRALAALGTPEAREKLMVLTNDREPEVRAVAGGTAP